LTLAKVTCEVAGAWILLNSFQASMKPTPEDTDDINSGINVGIYKCVWLEFINLIFYYV
jgi:hypothetical protein